ncbi:MAG: hypothetical protein ACKO96_36035 [Flammeovirgaceae bacterium]
MKKQRKKQLINALYLIIGCAVMLAIVVLHKPQSQQIKTPMPTVDDSIVNREYERLKTLE